VPQTCSYSWSWRNTAGSREDARPTTHPGHSNKEMKNGEACGRRSGSGEGGGEGKEKPLGPFRCCLAALHRHGEPLVSTAPISLPSSGPISDQPHPVDTALDPYSDRRRLSSPSPSPSPLQCTE